MCYKIKKALYFKSTVSCIPLFSLQQAQTRFKLDPNQKNTKYVLGKQVSAQYSFAILNQSVFSLALILCLLDLLCL
jgi:hypothetical protein